MLVVWIFNFGWLDVGFWLYGRWILDVSTLGFGYVDVGFWLYGC